MQQPADRQSLLADVTRVRLDELMRSDDSPLLESLRRLEAETDSDAVAGFSQGMS